MNPTLRPLKKSDLLKVKEIYEYYVEQTTFTFHIGEVSIIDIKEFLPIENHKYLSFMIVYDDEDVGYCYFAPYKKRQAYDRTAEVTLYIKQSHIGKGIGKYVMSELEKIALKLGIKILLGVITSENIKSIVLFEKCGFYKCAQFNKVGEKFDKILDVVVYEKEL